MVAAAVIGSAVVGAGASIAAGKKAEKASAAAAQSQREGLDAATAAQLEANEQRLEFDREQLGENRRQFETQLEYLKERQLISDDRYEALKAEGEQRYQTAQNIYSPFVQQGSFAAARESDLLGLSGADKQAAAIESIRQSPIYANLLQEGERRILANQSATGGIRGGDTQSALVRFAPQLLGQQIDEQLSRYGGLVNRGINAGTQLTGNPYQPPSQDFAGAVSGAYGTFGQQQAGLGQQVSQGLGTQGDILGNQYIQQGNIAAGGHLAQGQQAVNQAQNISNFANNALGAYQFNSLLSSGPGINTGGGGTVNTNFVPTNTQFANIGI